MPNDEKRAGLKIHYPMDLQLFAEGDPNPKPLGNGAVPPAATPNPVPGGETPKTYSEEELNRAKQSASSTAKNEILKELGITSVDEGKTLINAKSDQDKKIAELETRTKQIEEVANTEHQNAVMTSLQCDVKRLGDLRTLSLARVKEGHDFAASAKEVMDENPSWKVSQALPKPNLGGSNNPLPPNGTPNKSAVSADLKSMFPWLK